MTTTDLGDGCALYSRDEWAQGRLSNVDAGPDNRAVGEISEVVILPWSEGRALGHNDTAEWLRNLFDFHVKGDPPYWCDIPFHYCIDEDGGVWECRPLHLWSGATPGHNRRAVSVQVLFPPDGHDDTELALLAVAKVFELVQRAVLDAGGSGALAEVNL